MAKDAKSTASKGGKAVNGKGEVLLTAKTAVKIAIGVIAAGALMLSAHAGIVVPAVLHEAGKEMDAKIEHHEAFTHPGAVTKTEFRMLMDQLNRIETKVDK